jgi:hypothetical protein
MIYIVSMDTEFNLTTILYIHMFILDNYTTNIQN